MSMSPRSTVGLVLLAAAGAFGTLAVACSASTPSPGVDDSGSASADRGTSDTKKKNPSGSSTGSTDTGTATGTSATSTSVLTGATDVDAGALDAAAEAEVPPPPPPPPAPCGPAGAGVFASVDATGAWRYATSGDVAPGFSSRGLAFRLAPEGTAEAHATLYLSKSEKYADYLVTTVPSEGAADGYGPIAALGTVYLQELPGTVPLTRYYQTSPALRHLVSIDGAIGGWDPEPPRGYVCPR
jgi:hypothetical protein